MAEINLVTTKLKCPRCRSHDLYLTETGTWSSQWVFRNGGFDRNEGNHEPESIDRLDATCAECKHKWKPRGAHQIDDVVAEIA